jgi:hypothetical protein
MVARLFAITFIAVAFIAVTLFVLSVTGVAIAVVTGIALLNVFVVAFGLLSRRPPRPQPAPWQPSSFRLPPQPSDESEDQAPSEEQVPALTIYRQ